MKQSYNAALLPDAVRAAFPQFAFVKDFERGTLPPSLKKMQVPPYPGTAVLSTWLRRVLCCGDVHLRVNVFQGDVYLYLQHLAQLAPLLSAATRAL